jgi:predicted nuclease of restriction endonuclease-like (RecB) superfamily
MNIFDYVGELIEQARKHVGRTADITMCVTNFIIGKIIVEREQDGESRAKYGRGLIPELSVYLNSRFGRGFSETNLRNFRKFYQVYGTAIQQIDSAESENKTALSIRQIISDESQNGEFVPIQQILSAEFNPFKLGWSQYQVLMRIQNEDERHFYEIEAIEQQWSYEQLKRQYGSSLYERLALSRDKEDVLRLSREGLTLVKSGDMLKNPLVLEFLGMEEMAKYSESDLESAIIGNLQKFLLELGKGFLFEARQKRFTFDEKHFYVDLVFYNRLLQCYVLIDLKIDELVHQDLGQMQMYVNYFDRYVKKDFEKPTVGILLCKEKNDNIVELTLPKDSNIYASAYSLYLPDKELLQSKLAEWVEEFEETHGGDAE